MTYIDQCSKCGQECTRLIRARDLGLTRAEAPAPYVVGFRDAFVTSCCKAAPVAVKLSNPPVLGTPLAGKQEGT